MIAYASRTGTRTTLAALRAAGWRLLVSATGRHRTEGFRYAIDNGAWTAHQQGTPFDEAAFLALLEKHGDAADWIAAPDIVCGGIASLRKSESWLPRLATHGVPLLIPVQDGMTAADLRPVVGGSVGIFVGGSTPFKERTSPRIWGPLAREVGCHLHVGRVNTIRRIRICQDAGAHSFDGTSVPRFPCTIGRLDGALRQTHMMWG